MSIVQVFKFITTHPLTKKDRVKSLARFIKWQVSSRLMPYPLIYPFVGDTKIIVWRGLTGATGNVYAGLHEFTDMAFLLHFLRADDLFADIGANIGSYTILASGYNKANTISFEPIPSTFQSLYNNILINKIEGRVTALNIGLGAKPSTLKFTSEFDTVNHVVLESNESTSLLEVKVDTLDNTLKGKAPLLMKIDVEGFETEVLNGASDTLANTGVKAIIIELNGSGQRYGYKDEDIHNRLIGLGFAPFEYKPFERTLTSTSQQYNGNMLYIRDIEFAKQRVSSSPAVSILGQSF